MCAAAAAAAAVLGATRASIRPWSQGRGCSAPTRGARSRLPRLRSRLENSRSLLQAAGRALILSKRCLPVPPLPAPVRWPEAEFPPTRTDLGPMEAASRQRGVSHCLGSNRIELYARSMTTPKFAMTTIDLVMATPKLSMTTQKFEMTTQKFVMTTQKYSMKTSKTVFVLNK